jgi:hypothetical protein
MRLEDMMTVSPADPIMTIADNVTYYLSQSGYAFVEDDKVAALADALRSFLEAAGIPVDPATAAENLGI